MATATSNIPQEVATQGPQLASSGREFHRRMASISRQSAVYFAGTILTTAAGFFFKIFLARKLGAEPLGIYTLGMTIVGLLGLFNALGLPTAATRFVAAYCARGEFARLGTFLRGSLSLLSVCNLLFGSLLLFIGPWVAVHFYHLPALSPYLWAFALIMFFGVLNTFVGQVMAGYHDVSRRTLITHFLGVPANILFAVVLISIGFRLHGYLAAQVGSAILVFVLLARSVWKMTPPESRTFGPLAPVEREVVTFSAAAFGTAGLEFVLGQADKILLGRYLDVRQVGIYAVAMALVGFVPIALQSVNQIFSPTISELHATGNHSMLQLLYATLTKWVLILTIPLALTMIVFAHPLMSIFGPSFAPGAAFCRFSAIDVRKSISAGENSSHECGPPDRARPNLGTADGHDWRSTGDRHYCDHNEFVAPQSCSQQAETVSLQFQLPKIGFPDHPFNRSVAGAGAQFRRNAIKLGICAGRDPCCLWIFSRNDLDLGTRQL